MAEAALEAPTALAAFLDWEERQVERFELLDGRVMMMTGGTIDHAEIARNLTSALHDKLKGGLCRAYQSDVKVVTPSGAVLYPDVLVRCGERRGRDTRVTDPVLVAEILSASTSERDLGEKRWAYQTLPSLQHILLVSQTDPIVEVVTRDADGETWRSVVLRGLEHMARLPALEIEVSMAEVYAGVIGVESGRD